MEKPRVLGSNLSVSFGFGYGYGGCVQSPTTITIEIKSTAELYLINLYFNLDSKPFHVLGMGKISENQSLLCKQALDSGSSEVMLDLLRTVGSLQELEILKESKDSGVSVRNVHVIE